MYFMRAFWMTAAMRRGRMRRYAAAAVCGVLLLLLLHHMHEKTEPDKYLWPVSGGTVTDAFGAGRGHGGIDLAAPTGTEIYAAADGTVGFAGWGTGYGNYIILLHEDGRQTVYGHCAELLVQQGMSVQCGEQIALVGATGDATGPHLHFEVRENGERVDPAPYIALPLCKE